MLSWVETRTDVPSSTTTIKGYDTNFVFGFIPQTVTKDIDVTLNGYSCINYECYSGTILVGTLSVGAFLKPDTVDTYIVTGVSFRSKLKFIRAKAWPSPNIDLEQFDPTKYKNFVQTKFDDWLTKAGLTAL